MNHLTVYPTWGTNDAKVTVPTPSWMAPPMPEPRWETRDAVPIRISLLPTEGPRSYSSIRPPMAALPPAATALPSVPPPPPYPDLRVEFEALQTQLAATVSAMAELRHRVLNDAERQLVALACAIGERIAGRELGLDPGLVVAWAREAIEQLDSDGSVVVAISSDIAASLQEAAWAPVRSASVTIETDATLGAGACEVRGARASMDVSLESRTEAVRRAVVGSTT